MPGPKLFWISKSDRIEPIPGEDRAASLFPGPSLARHLMKSLRAEIGDQFLFCLPESCETFLGEIQTRNPLSLILAPAPDLGWKTMGRSSLQARLAFSPLKGDAFTEVLGMSVMAGLDGIAPILSERTVADWNDKARWERKRERFDHLVREKSQLCGRCDPIEIESPIPLESFLEKTPSSIIFWFDEESESSIPFEEILSEPLRFLTRSSMGDGKTLWGLVGPEGGWDDKERQLSERLGQSGHILRVSLGPRTLSAEGAAIAVVSILGFVMKPLFQRFASSSTSRTR